MYHVVQGQSLTLSKLQRQLNPARDGLRWKPAPDDGQDRPKQISMVDIEETSAVLVYEMAGGELRFVPLDANSRIRDRLEACFEVRFGGVE